MVGMPTITPEANKLIYVLKNKKKKTPLQILLLPYLHERRILLNKTQENCQYFYTAVTRGNITQLICLNISHSKLYIYSLEGTLKNRFDFSSLTKKYGRPQQVSENG